VEDWVRWIDQGQVVDVGYLDLMKAFDTVPHRRLIKKLHSYGFSGQILRWVKAFISERTQVVRVNGATSHAAQVLSGVPQGSVLGPVLFVIYVNDMPARVSSSIRLYADDTKLYRPISSPSDAQALQDDLSSLETWSDEWLLKFHPEKCTMLRIGTKKSPLSTYTMHHEGGRVALKWEVTEKDLGILIDEKLTFHEEVNSRVKKANSIVGIIRRSFTHLDEKMFTTLFKALVRPHLEYAVAVWNPHLKKDTNSIEAVQRRATKLIPGFRDLTYQQRLHRLNLPSLEFRRLRGDMIETFKIIRGIYNIDKEDFFNINSHSTTRGHPFKIIKPTINSSIRKNYFTFRIINTWNSLPENIVLAPSLNAFKNRLDKFWKNHPTRFLN
jgi:ribonuclease P/MRP protein subunit RPP40